MGLEKESLAAGGTAREAGASKGLRNHSGQVETYHVAADAVEHDSGSRGQISLLDKWRYQLAASQDETLTLVDQAVLFRLLDCLNTRTLLCKPSIEFLCEAIKRGRTVVTEAITRLKNAGWLVIRRRRGASEYGFPRMGADELSSTETLRRQTRKSRETGTSRSPAADETEHLECRDTGTPDVRDSGHLNTGSENGNLKQGKSLSPTSLATQTDAAPEVQAPLGDEAFEEFWQAYPTPYGIAPSRIAYRAAILHRGATPQRLLAAAKRYAFQRAGEDPKYTKAPANWLNHDCWREEAAKTVDENSPTLRPCESAPRKQSNFMAHLRRLAPAVAAMGA